MTEFARRAWWVRVPHQPQDIWYTVAVDRPDDALAAIRLALDLPDDHGIKCYGHVREPDFSRLELLPGEVRKFV